MKLLITLYIIGGLISFIVCINYVQHKRRAKNDICRDCANLRMIYANGDHECNNRSFPYKRPPQVCGMYEPKETPQECKESCEDCMYCYHERSKPFRAHCAALRQEIYSDSICSNFKTRRSPNPSSLNVKTISAEYPIPASLMNSHDLLKAHLVERLAVDILQYAKFETVHDLYAGDTLKAMIKVVDPNE